MSKVDDIEGLMLDCVQDLHAAELAALRALPPLAGKMIFPALREAVEDHLAQTREQASRLEQIAAWLGQPAKGPGCIWADGILDDANHDTKMVRGGRLLDAALIGAMRKLEQSEVVSYETAIEVARSMDRADMVELLERTHREECAMDRTLHALLRQVLAA